MEKLTKKQAKDLYNKGIEVLFVPAKMGPLSVPKVSRNVKASIKTSQMSFEAFIEYFLKYHCWELVGLSIKYYRTDLVNTDSIWVHTDLSMEEIKQQHEKYLKLLS